MGDLLDALKRPQTMAVLVFLAGYVYICWARRFRALVLWAGVALLLLLGVYRPAEQPGEVGVVHLLTHINWNVLMVLAGAMVVADLFIISKVPVLLADLLVRHLKTVGGAALGVCALASLLSAFIDNVTTVLIVAPIAIELARRLEVSPVYFIIGLAISSNLQGTATLIGDPPSLILAGEMQLDFLDFFFYQGKPGIFWAVQMGAVGSILVLWLLFFRRYRRAVTPPEVVRPTSWFPTWLLLAKILGLSVVSQLPAGVLPNGELYANGAVCMTAGFIGLTWYLFREGKSRTLQALFRTDFATVALLAGIFALTFALKETGFISRLASGITHVVGDHKFVTYSVIVLFSVLCSAFIDNVPYTAVMLPAVLEMAGRFEAAGGTAAGFIPTPTHVLFGFGLLVGACLGGNISPVGAAANIVGVNLLRKRGHDVGFWKFAGMGFPFTIAATVPAYLFLWWLWG
jgi:Na+/H+ antiporter NhaD/arsenite permease-like protein